MLNRENRRADALSLRSNYIEMKESFNTSTPKKNKGRILLVKSYELNITLRIFRDN